MLAVLCCAVVLAMTGNARPQTQEPKGPQYQALTGKFFELLAKGSSSEAIDYLFNTNPRFNKMTDKIDQLKTQFASLRTLSGTYVSQVKLVETKVGDIYVYQHFFVAYDRQPISVRITYYKPGANWVCQSLQFDTDVDDVIRKAADNSLRLEQ